MCGNWKISSSALSSSKKRAPSRLKTYRRSSSLTPEGGSDLQESGLPTGFLRSFRIPNPAHLLVRILLVSSGKFQRGVPSRDAFQKRNPFAYCRDRGCRDPQRSPRRTRREVGKSKPGRERSGKYA